ncbi:MAG: glutamyl-tRNA reductase, partial [Saprospiraceae bacterium]|nr:glutamyl-tRNA reductase [Saprospiraceae bacterium]
MLGTYKILTVTHKSTDLKKIGRFVLRAEGESETSARLLEIRDHFGIEELFYLPTCNRVMFFMSTRQTIDKAFMARFFEHVNPELDNDTLSQIDQIVQYYEGIDAIAHLNEVASSIDSLVVGERQILRQLREAYEKSLEWGLTGDDIRLAVQQAIVTAKSVYSKTRIGNKPVSIVSLAVQRLMATNPSRDARILLVGAGQTNQLVGKFLVKHEFSSVTVFNRSLKRAEKLARALNGRAYSLDELADYKDGFDCMIVCTGAVEPIITGKVYRSLLAGDTQRKTVIDLAIPRNVAQEVIEDFTVNYIEIDSLRHLAKKNLAFREEEVNKARKWLDESLESFPVYYRQRRIELAMRRVPEDIKAVKHRALDQVFKKEVESMDQ